ncbi:MAG: ABC transporter permease subunit [Burkholderiaceae bacterium]|nr:ABC transporter permease subunit [Burkholderiaceae bacterium]
MTRDRRKLPALLYDALAALLVAALIVFLAETSRELAAPLSALQATPISLDPAELPHYAARTTLRMLAALVLSLAFTFTYATLAAKSRRAEKLLIPLLDILQSVPILGFLSVTIVFLMSLAPGQVLGAELASIFAIFTSQAWNMAFSFYQSLRTVPKELAEAARSFRLSPWMRFWRLEVPFAMPQLVWNMMMSMSGAWFFVVAAEAISVGSTQIALPGIGSYIAEAVAQRDLRAVAWAIAAMLLVILAYDQLLFRPLVAWADALRFEQEVGVPPARSWVLDLMRRARWTQLAFATLRRVWRRTYRPLPAVASPARHDGPRPWLDHAWNAALLLAATLAAAQLARFALHHASPTEALQVFALGLATLVRVMILIALASLLWVPIGVWVGLRPPWARAVQPLAQFLAAFPANLLFPLAVSAIVALRLDPDLWLSPLMILGTQWYILFNVIAGAAAIPSELRQAADNLQLRGWLWWRKVALPAVFPYYVTGAITASGGFWNASIVAEVASWGDVKLQARGLGAYIAQASEAGDFHRLALGIGVMCVFVIAINRALWRPLYRLAETRYRLG